MSAEKMREKFEAATLEIYANADLVRKDEGYRNAHIQSAWWGWKASRAAIEVELPVAISSHNQEVIKAVGRHIISQGLKIKQ